MPVEDVPDFDAHLAQCSECQGELDPLRTIVSRLLDFPGDDLKPAEAVRGRLAQRIADTLGREISLASHAPALPDWAEVIPGVSCKLLSTDALRNRVSMLVKLAAGGEYPPHTHADAEELHLLDGELWIDGRKLFPGDFQRSEPGTSDRHVWSETGCTCVLITSPSDVLG